MPIIEWKYRRMMRLLKHFIMESKKDSKWNKSNTHPEINILNHDFIWHDEEVFNFSDQTRTEEPLHFNGKDIIVHKNFRLFFISSHMEFAFSHTLFSKLIFIQCELEDEHFWK